jgi:hypothetical protein
MEVISHITHRLNKPPMLKEGEKTAAEVSMEQVGMRSLAFINAY